MDMDSVDIAFVSSRVEDTANVLLLDVRPFMSYNTSHVQGSVNVHLPPIVKRRSNGFVALEYIVRSEKERSSVANGEYKLIIAYDQSTEDLCSAEKNSNLYVVMDSLRQQTKSKVVYMRGGYAGFQSCHPQLTVAPNSNTLLSLAPPIAPRSISPNRRPVDILPHLFIGDLTHASDRDLLVRMGFTAVLNVSSSCSNYFENDFNYMQIPVQDNSSADLLCWFPAAIAFIETIKKAGGKVLVHCKAGISRSATICLAYLMAKNNLSLETAYDHIRQRRNAIDPNLNFMRQLKDFETQLNCSRVRRGSLSEGCSPLTPSGNGVHSFTFPVSSNYTPLVSPS